MPAPASAGPGAAGARLLLALTVLLALLLPAPAEAEAAPLATGVTNIGEEPLLAFQRIREAGARYVRIPLYWRGTAPQQRPGAWQASDPFDSHYTWQASDEDVSRAVQAGLTPVLQIEGAPSWAQRCGAPGFLGGGVICDPEPEALAQFATAAATRYSGRFPGLPRVTYWQALNEPNLSLFFFPQYDTAGTPLSPGLYRALLNSFYAAVKSVDPTNLVIAAGLGPIAVPQFTIGPMRFTQLLLCMSGGRRPRPVGGDCGVHVDIFAIHPYTTGGPTHKGKGSDVELGDLAKLQRLLRAADRAGRISGAFERTPLWITEFSWDSNPPDPGGLPMRIETRWTAEALHQAWSAGVANFFWFSLRDAPHEPGRSFSETLQAGLYFRGPTLEQDQPKPVLAAFRFPFVAYPTPQGLSVWGRTPSSRGGEVAIQVLRHGRWRRALTMRADGSGIFRGVGPSAYGADKRGSARAVYRRHASPPFSMRPVPDFRQPPFG